MADTQKLNILYEEAGILAVNKPAGLVVHSDGRTEEKTLSDLLIREYPEIKEVGEPWENNEGKVIYRPGIVHRIDRDTSGVLLVAKDQKTYLYLKEQFQDRKISKKYHAFAYGNIKEEEGSIDKPIGKSKKDFRQWSAQPGARGTLREAVTEFRVLKRMGEYVFLELSPKTGRTHQLRVHLKAIHHPIMCDSLYAPNRECGLGFERLALHARSIDFFTPDGKNHLIEAPYPEDFVKALATS
ncbi:MAG: RluA family pseudouridine synthase [Candidatus Pacebacteria bacterium]|nr:RluA family pseudouridine synthase [Candidatus Paceibacterota bacterium]